VRLSMCSKTVCLGIVSIGLAGCASQAPELPRYVQQSTEVGYSTPYALKAGSIATKKIAQVTQASWINLSDAERKKITELYEVGILEDDQFGLITDVQGVDQSTQATSGGAMLGGAAANAAYLDSAIRGGSYSVTNQLAIGILGAALGSSMDSKATSQFQFRYTVKLGDGDIKYFDEVKSTAFRHSIGVCVTVPSMTLLSQHVCTQTPDSVRKRFLN
jgi:outer membrane lipoprotein SlyB